MYHTHVNLFPGCTPHPTRGGSPCILFALYTCPTLSQPTLLQLSKLFIFDEWLSFGDDTWASLLTDTMDIDLDPTPQINV